MQLKVDFILAGAAKSGTTSLHRYLGEHPQIFMPEAHELDFFYAPKDDAREQALVNHFYRNARNQQKIGLSRTSMLMSPEIPDRINDHNPEAKVIIILRNPLDRAYSAYWHSRLQGWDKSANFEEALQRELRGELKTRAERFSFAYLQYGHYQEQIEGYAELLGGDRLKTLLMEDLIESPRQTLAELLSWLGVSPDTDSIKFEKRHNVTRVHRFPAVSNILRRISAPARRFLSKRLSTKTVRRVKDRIRRLDSFSYVPFERPPIRQETRDFLRSYYTKHNSQLGDLIGRNVSHWD